jgi:hypothetical protein
LPKAVQLLSATPNVAQINILSPAKAATRSHSASQIRLRLSPRHPERKCNAEKDRVSLELHSRYKRVVACEPRGWKMFDAKPLRSTKEYWRNFDPIAQ